jgi:hypothetical protein
MRKLFSFLIGLFAMVLPSVAQSHDFNPNDREPEITVKISKEQIPLAIQNAVNVQFSKDDPKTWSRFPYALKEYGWVYDVGAKDLSLDRFQVEMKTKKGTDLKAIYTVNGELIESDEVSTNSAIPPSVMEEFLKSKYKDWKIVGNREVIRFYHDHNNSSVEQHFRITVEKDGVKRSISFNWQGSN